MLIEFIILKKSSLDFFHQVLDHRLSTLKDSDKKKYHFLSSVGILILRKSSQFWHTWTLELTSFQHYWLIPPAIVSISRFSLEENFSKTHQFEERSTKKLDALKTSRLQNSEAIFLLSTFNSNFSWKLNISQNVQHNFLIPTKKVTGRIQSVIGCFLLHKKRANFGLLEDTFLPRGVFSHR